MKFLKSVLVKFVLLYCVCAGLKYVVFKEGRLAKLSISTDFAKPHPPVDTEASLLVSAQSLARLSTSLPSCSGELALSGPGHPQRTRPQQGSSSHLGKINPNCRRG